MTSRRKWAYLGGIALLASCALFALWSILSSDVELRPSQPFIRQAFEKSVASSLLENLDRLADQKDSAREPVSESSTSIKLEGIVQDAGGVPIPMAKVFLCLGANTADALDSDRRHAWKGRVLRTKGNEGGVFSFWFEPGQDLGLLVAEAFGFHDAQLEVGLPARGPVVVTMEKKPARSWLLRGNVVDGATGQPVTDFQISLAEFLVNESKPDFSGEMADVFETRRFQNPEGQFQFPFSAGKWTSSGRTHRYRGIIQAPGFAMASIGPMSPSEESLLIVLNGGVPTLRGRVLEEGSGRPVLQAQVRWKHENIPVVVQVDHEGRFSFPSLPPNTVQGLQFSAPGYAPQCGGWDLKVNREVEVFLSPGGEIAGDLARDDGEPWAGAKVIVVGKIPVMGDVAEGTNWEHQREGTTSATGNFEFAGLPAGQYVVYVQEGEYSVHSYPSFSRGQFVSLRAGERQTIRIGGKPTATLRGKLVQRSRDPHDAQIWNRKIGIVLIPALKEFRDLVAEDFSRPLQDIQVHNDWTWALPGVEIGRYFLGFFRAPGSFFAKPVEVDRTGPLDLGTMVLFMDYDFSHSPREYVDMGPIEKNKLEEERAKADVR